MNAINAFLFLIIFPLTTFLLQAQKPTIDKPYFIEKGKIVINKVVNNPSVTIKTTETVFFDQWGKRIARYTTTTTTNQFLPKPKIERKFSLKDGAEVTSVDLDDMTGVQTTVGMVDDMSQMNAAQLNQFAGQMKDIMKAKTESLGQETVAGKVCEVTKTTSNMMGMEQSTTEWRWQNIVLKTVSHAMGSEITEEATEVEEGYVPADKFIPPAGAEIKKMTTKY